jgi:hypothetical protein
LGVLILLSGVIIIPPAPDHPPAISGTMKISCPLTFCLLQKQDAGADSILFLYQSGIGSSRATRLLSS